MNSRKFIELYRNEMIIRNYSKRTIDTYVNIVDIFLKKYDSYAEPKAISEDVIKQYLLSISNYSSAWIKQNIGSLKLFYSSIIKQPLKFKYIHYPRREQKLPEVLSLDEMQRLISAIKNIKHKSIVTLIYSCGLRVSELINLKISDIDSNRMMIRICQGKGKKDRYVSLPENVLALLRQYYKAYHPKEYLFNGQFKLQYSTKSIENILKNNARLAQISKNVKPHSLRHTFAVHHLEQGTDIRYIQLFLGHKNIKTTERYTHVSNLNINRIQSPITNIAI